MPWGGALHLSCSLLLAMPQEDENYLGEDTFRVERIVRKRVNDGTVEYLIKWEGWSRCVRSLAQRPRHLACRAAEPQPLCGVWRVQ